MGLNKGGVGGSVGGGGSVGSGGGVTQSVIFDDTFIYGLTVYADGVKPLTDPGSRDGWYFKNDKTNGISHIASLPITESQKEIGRKKINWYFFDSNKFNSRYDEFTNAFAVVTIDAAPANVIPFFYMYTTIDNINIAKAHIFSTKSNLSQTISVGKTYLIWFGTEEPNQNIYPGVERVQLLKSNNSVPEVASEKVFAVAYTTNSSVEQNLLTLQTYMLGFKTSTDSQNYELRVSSPSSSSGATISFPITTAQTSWVINHNLNKFPSVTTIGEDKSEIKGTVVYDSPNQITISFSPAVKGTVYLN